MAYIETFVFTPLPSGVDGSKLRIAVVVSPRLSRSDSFAEDTLDHWPDARDWPSIEPSWQVTLKQGSTEVTLPAVEVKPEPYDTQTWSQLFPPSMPVVPYRVEDRSSAPIFSYPAAAVRDTAKQLHVNALTSSRDDFPRVSNLKRDSTFGRLRTAARPRHAASVLESQLAGPRPDAETPPEDAFAMAEMFHGVRPGSQTGDGEPPAITALNFDSGTRGSAIVVTGRHFGPAPHALLSNAFGWQEAQVTSAKADGTGLTFIVPSTGVGGVTQLRVRKGDLLSNPVQFTITGVVK
ncbi:MAG TPA: hypothetical protein VF062_08705 [Candidatus Limnocylindrales bacterium]